MPETPEPIAATCSQKQSKNANFEILKFFLIFLSFCVQSGVDGLKMVKKPPRKGLGFFKYPKFLTLDDTLKPQKFCSGYVQNSPQPHS